MKKLFAICGPLCGLFLVSSPLLQAQPGADQKPIIKKPEPTKFIRLQLDKNEVPTALETAVVRYVPADGKGDLTVDLVAAVHIGDKAYYNQLNKLMEQYDVLLYELVAPPGTRIPKGGKKNADNPLAFVMQMAKRFLALELQTERIDYTKENFVHADLSPEGMVEAMKERGDDPFTLALGIAADLMRQQNVKDQAPKKKAKPLPNIDPLDLLLDPEAGVKLKRVLAEQLGDVDAIGNVGQTLGNILIADRNEACMKVFQKQLTRGKKKIGIFYGGAHMPDFEKRLKEDFGLKKQSEQWITAWDLSD